MACEFKLEGFDQPISSPSDIKFNFAADGTISISLLNADSSLTPLNCIEVGKTRKWYTYFDKTGLRFVDTKQDLISSADENAFYYADNQNLGFSLAEGGSTDCIIGIGTGDLRNNFKCGDHCLEQLNFVMDNSDPSSIDNFINILVEDDPGGLLFVVEHNNWTTDATVDVPDISDKCPDSVSKGCSCP